jgi:hypothetical protein
VVDGFIGYWEPSAGPRTSAQRWALGHNRIAVDDESAVKSNLFKTKQRQAQLILSIPLLFKKLGGNKWKRL